MFGSFEASSRAGQRQRPWIACQSRPRILEEAQVRSPVSMYRLVNVPVNPSGRCGAPETEPGPCGVGRLVDDELMAIPFQQVVPPYDRASGGRVAPVTPWP